MLMQTLFKLNCHMQNVKDYFLQVSAAQTFKRQMY